MSDFVIDSPESYARVKALLDQAVEFANPITTGSKYAGIKTSPSVPLGEGGNLLIGNNDALSMAGVFGDSSSTGWLSPALGLAEGLTNAYMGYKQLQETKKTNAKKLALLEEANKMKKLQMKNKVNQANRYAMLGMGNSNSAGATMRTVQQTPYASMR
jgi:hypothetical protein